jgi:hypothetical protein
VAYGYAWRGQQRRGEDSSPGEAESEVGAWPSFFKVYKTNLIEKITKVPDGLSDDVLT